VAFTGSDVGVEVLASELRTDHAAPVRPDMAVKRQDAGEEHWLGRHQPVLGAFIVVELGRQNGLEVLWLNRVDALLSSKQGRDDGVRIAVFCVLAAEMVVEEVAAERCLVNLVLTVQTPWHGKGVGGMSDRRAFGCFREAKEVAFLPHGLSIVGEEDDQQDHDHVLDAKFGDLDGSVGRCNLLHHDMVRLGLSIVAHADCFLPPRDVGAGKGQRGLRRKSTETQV